MTVTTIKVSAATRDRVKALSAETHQSAEQVIQDALDELDCRLFWDRYDAAAAAEAAPSAEETAEHVGWDATLTDGLDD